MKKGFIATLGILSILSCGEKKFGAFEITGQITHAPVQKVYLHELPFSGDPPVVLDSTTINKSGDFSLKAIAREESLYMLVFERGNSVLFINDENNLRIRIDANDFRRYEMEGSAASTQLHELLEKLWVTDSTLSSIAQQKDSLNNSDSTRTVARLRTEQLIDKRRAFLNTFIKKTNSPAAICYAIRKYDPGTPITHIKQLMDAAATRFPGHSGIVRFRELITREVEPEKPAYALLGQPAPGIRLPTPAGDTLALSSLKGKYVLVDFWASWCGPCRRENPNVVATYNKYKDKNFTILGVSLDQQKDKWIDAIQKDGLAWNHVSDLRYWESVVVEMYRFRAIPFNVLIDPNGNIIAADLHGAALDQKLSEVLN